MIGKLLGHTQVQATARYAHLARDSIQNAAARITGSIGGNLVPGEERAARLEGLTPPSAVAILAEHPRYSLGAPPESRQQLVRLPIGNHSMRHDHAMAWFRPSRQSIFLEYMRLATLLSNFTQYDRIPLWQPMNEPRFPR